jgi:fructose-specific component phosphotransferase system IIB-like protein
MLHLRESLNNHNKVNGANNKLVGISNAVKKPGEQLEAV